MSHLLPLDVPTAKAMLRGTTAKLVAAAEHPNVFTPEQCARVAALRDTLGADVARVESRDGAAARVVEREVRDTERTHILPIPAHTWIYKRLSEVVQEVNNAAWQLRISHLEPPQLLTYREGQHYNWHADLGSTGVMSLRKVSMTVLLSDPADFDGGALEISAGSRTLSPPFTQGSAVLFPSWQAHRVSPVTRGVRQVLVVWVVGKRPLR